jgi:hypothetical protein
MNVVAMQQMQQAGPVVALPLDACREFIDALVADGLVLSSLDVLKDQRIFDAHRDAIDRLTVDLYMPVHDSLDNPKCGIIGVDVPPELATRPTADAVMGAVIAAAVAARFMTPALDVRNGTPFTLYTASAQNETRLKQAGLKFFSPNEKLGFHTDGLIRNDAIYVPRYLALYNILIAYRRPGNFHWVPFSLWPDFERYGESIGWNVPYRFAMTPIVYSGVMGQASPPAPRFIKAPIFWRDGGQQQAVFLNGEVIGPASATARFDMGHLIDMKDSISMRSARLAVPQRARRLILMNNGAGFHARDVFADPVPDVRYTRSFMRSVSTEGLRVYN